MYVCCMLFKNYKTISYLLRISMSNQVNDEVKFNSGCDKMSSDKMSVLAGTYQPPFEYITLLYAAQQVKKT